MSAPANVRLETGDAAPSFSLTDDHGGTVRLADLRGRRVVLYVYPAAMTPGCTTQACDFRDSLSALAAAGITVLGLSPDEPPKLARFREKEHLTFPLLSDPDKDVLRAYGAYGQKQLYGKTVEGVIRSTFVIDAKGKVEQAQYNVRATGHVAKLRRDLGVD
jgi:thioredoxin-dependent peroxiredoxin